MTRSTGPRISRRGLIAGASASIATAAGFGAAPAIGQARPLKIGALLPLTGGLDPLAEQMWLGVQAAVADINGAGGVLGRPVEAVYRDAEGTPRHLAALCRSLVDEDGISGAVGPFIAAGRKAASRAFGERGVALVSASNNEGVFCRPNYFSLGPAPNQDMVPLARHLAGGAPRAFFLVGSNSSWQHGGFRRAVLDILYGQGGSVLGQAHTNIGEENFDPVIRWIAETEAEAVIFCVPRPQGVAFVKQARALGLLEKVRFGWVGFNELHASRLTPEEAGHVTTVTPFVSDDSDGGVPDLVARMRGLSGAETPVTYYAYLHYCAVTAIAEACREQGEISPAAVLAGLPGLSFESATGVVTIDATTHHASYNLVVARGEGDRLAIVERLGQVAADPGCSAA
jgi:ABC-type branched-subunit amino acid transport system substrate-binding protein